MLQQIGYGFKDSGTAALDFYGKKKERSSLTMEAMGGIQIVKDKV